MKGKYLYVAVMAFTAITSAYADPPKGFEEFRKGIMDNFNSFKSRILDHYADFLAGEWHEYEALEAEERYTEPKPSAMPTLEIADIEEGDTQKKELLATYGFIDNNLRPTKVKPESPYLNWLRHTPNLYSSPIPAMKDTEVDMSKVIFDENASSASELTDSDPADSVVADNGAPLPTDGDIVTEKGLLSNYNGDIFTFYGMQFALPKVDFDVVKEINTVGQFSNQWKLLDEQGVADKLIPSIKRLQEVSGLSDYLIFEMIMAYADYKMPDANDASKMAFTHHILTNMEFGVRLALDNNGEPFMLIPFDEKVYGRSNLTLDKTYYLFSTPGRDYVQRMGLNTPALPEDVDLGRPLHLRMEGLTLPNNPFHYVYEHEGIKIEGDMNQNIIPMLYRYPNMDTSGFAASLISKDVRDDVVRQIKEQLGEEDPLKATDRLLALVQFAFPYATDDEFHGFEKPYFFEEILFYPLSDCEDRAVFYSYLVWNALGIETDLIAYPNHEAAAVKAEKVWGGNSYYERDGLKYFISDPTFQGAPTGMAMPRYRSVNPTIDLSYPQEN